MVVDVVVVAGFGFGCVEGLEFAVLVPVSVSQMNRAKHSSALLYELRQMRQDEVYFGVSEFERDSKCT